MVRISTGASSGTDRSYDPNPLKIAIRNTVTSVNELSAPQIARFGQKSVF
jgi:hypothetical protein